MRLRDIVRDSFAAATAARLLAPHEPAGRYETPPERFGSVFRPAQLRHAHYASPRGPLYGDPAQWRRAYEFVRAFSAAAAAGSPGYTIERCFGSFGRLGAADVFQHVLSALEACGLKQVGLNAILHEAQLEATDNVKVESLPEPYGHWLHHQTHQPRWIEPVSLRLAVRFAITTTFVRTDGAGGHLEPSVTLQLSAPAISLLRDAERRLAPTLRLVRASPPSRLVAADRALINLVAATPAASHPELTGAS
ncbi:MAG TPA: hypothetical protein VGH49_10520 [Xanthobacteraceae bacterium]